MSLLTTSCQVMRDRPRFLLSSGTQRSTCLAILSSFIFWTCPNHLSLHSWTVSSNIFWPVCSLTLLLHTIFVHDIFKIFLSHWCHVASRRWVSVLVKGQVLALHRSTAFAIMLYSRIFIGNPSFLSVYRVCFSNPSTDFFLTISIISDDAAQVAEFF